MKKTMTVTYEVDGALYINATNRCSNRCDFCIRNNADGAYGSDSLWLEREPSVSEILDSVFSTDVEKYREIVFCGYGEPSYRLAECREVALEIKKRGVKIPVRINTNGQSSLILGVDSAPMYKDAFDKVSISLNSPTAQGYQKICHSRFGEGAFDGILDFAKEVKKYVPQVVFSVVRETLTDEELQLCRDISRECGVDLKVRTYIPPIQPPDSSK